MARALARAVLFLLMLGSLALTGLNLNRLADTGLGRGMIERSTAEISAALERQLARTATAEAIAARIEAQLADEPRNWVVITALTDLAGERGIALPPDLQEAVAAADEADHGWVNGSLTCAACAYDVRNCPLSPVLACQLSGMLTPVGDVVAIARESGNYIAGTEVDELDLGLSVVGLGSYLLAAPSGGTSFGIYMGARTAKTARRLDLLSPPLRATLVDAFRRGIDWRAIPRSRSTDDLARALRPEVLRPVTRMLDDTFALSQRAGGIETLHLIRYIDTPADARRLAGAAEAVGPRMIAPLELMGKSRFLRLTMRFADELWYAIAGFAAFVASLSSLVVSAVISAANRQARRSLRACPAPVPPQLAARGFGVRSS
ncbi:hypothetical protein [Halodurantibacterium flavum]|uniref:Uncharacterized protein n=1 Tax=Halodurantibacterium flavum TaxID=1382802 RepID=A0ABW4S8W0_9RHOB